MTSSEPQHDGAPLRAVLDPTVLQSLRELGGDDDPGLVTELVAIFLSDAPKRMAEIRSGLAGDDWKLLERAAHTLKSSSANIGALGLSALCRDLEESARTRDAGSCRLLLGESTRCLVDVAAALESLRT